MCFVNPLTFQPSVRCKAPLQSTWRIMGFFTCNPMSSNTHIASNIICATSHASINSPSAILRDTLSCILLFMSDGGLIQKDLEAPTLLQEFDSVTSPESKILSIWNLNFFPPSQSPSACMTIPLSGIQRMCCITHSISFMQFGYALVMNHMSSRMLFAIFSHNHFSRYNNFPTPLQYLICTAPHNFGPLFMRCVPTVSHVSNLVLQS